MQFLNKNIELNFMSKRKIAAFVSAILLLVSIGSLIVQGLNFGIDFTGGTMIEVAYQEEAKLDVIRNTLNQNGYDDVIVQNFGSIHDVLIRLPVIETENMAELSNKVLAALQAEHETTIDVRRVEFVGPQVGEELTEQGGLAMLYALFGYSHLCIVTV